MKKRILCLILCVVLLLPMICSCGDLVDDTGATKLSFKSASTYSYLKTLDGQKVTINGYMATSSPVDGSFMFLMNLPYQSCPFCVPNTSQLSNTMEVYPKWNQSFTYTTQAIKVVGTLQVAPSETDYFQDSYGYQFNFKIVDASYKILSADELGKDIALWQSIASSDVISEIYKMYDYVNFLCAWNTYFINNYTDENGVEHKGFYLYPSDAEKLLKTEGQQWNYGYKEGYFDNIIKEIRSIDENAFSSLIANVERARALANKAIKELDEKKYTSEYKYVEKFETYDYIYTLNNGEELINELEATYQEFSSWLASWEM